METIKVNMNPNPLDVQTIHASQNDGEARQWEFELHNNGELIDTSEITEQLFFKSYKGGTEQILPENTSTPTTSPFKGDIKYPQGLLTDQEFTYRQSPTEEDGLAKITDIKGNTLVWNQLQPNNISRTNNGVTYTYDNGKLTVTGTATSTSWWLYGGLPTMSMKANHKYLFVFGKGMEGSSITTFHWYLPNSLQRFYADGIITINSDTEQYVQLQVMQGYTINTVLYPQVFDLTQIFGTGNEPSTVEEFTSLFPLSYYSYNQGTLLSFNGNGIKTVGKNLLPFPYKDTRTTVANVGITVNNDGSIKLNGTANASLFFDLGNADVNNIDILPGTYTVSSRLGKARIVVVKNSSYFATTDSSTGKVTFTITEQCKMYFYVTASSGTVFNNETIYPQFEFGSSQTSYEPYTESVINLPISTYFPTGMKSAGSVYDELTPSKATTRIGEVTFNGSENWYYDSNNRLFQCAVPNGIITNATTQYNVYTKNNRFDDKSWATRSEGSLGMYYGASFIFIKSTQFADVNALKTWLQSNPVTVYYELATPTETSFTTASLVTENAEIPLSNEDGTLIGKCTEQLSSESGFFDAKIKLADEDGECYSNKLQLHVERSPQ